jgi:hypothetical protein
MVLPVTAVVVSVGGAEDKEEDDDLESAPFVPGVSTGMSIVVFHKDFL